MEKLVQHHLSHYLETNSLLADEQYGFRKSHSTVHAIAQLTNHVNKKLDAKLSTLAVFVDFLKASDCATPSPSKQAERFWPCRFFD